MIINFNIGGGGSTPTPTPTGGGNGISNGKRTQAKQMYRVNSWDLTQASANNEYGLWMISTSTAIQFRLRIKTDENANISRVHLQFMNGWTNHSQGGEYLLKVNGVNELLGGLIQINISNKILKIATTKDESQVMLPTGNIWSQVEGDEAIAISEGVQEELSYTKIEVDEKADCTILSLLEVSPEICTYIASPANRYDVWTYVGKPIYFMHPTLGLLTQFTSSEEIICYRCENWKDNLYYQFRIWVTPDIQTLDTYWGEGEQPLLPQ